MHAEPALRKKLCDACGRQGGSLGELNHLIVLDQFQRLRAGDSWWYERSGVLDAATLLEVQGTLFVSQTLTLCVPRACQRVGESCIRLPRSFRLGG